MPFREAGLVTRQVCMVHGTEWHKGAICLTCLPKNEVGFVMNPHEEESREIWDMTAESLGFPDLIIGNNDGIFRIPSAKNHSLFRHDPMMQMEKFRGKRVK